MPRATIATWTLRPVAPNDDPALASIIRSVMPEFGADGPGFAIHDAEVDAMYASYTQPRCTYFVVELDGEVAGGGGVAPLQHASPEICELRKMYFLPRLRGRGAGDAVIQRSLQAARDFGFARCYLETLHGMEAAQKLYERHGFRRIEAPLGNTGHFGCNRFYLLGL